MEMLMTIPEHRYTPDELAKVHRVSKVTILRLIWDKKLPAERIGTQYRIKQSDWEAYLERNKPGR